MYHFYSALVIFYLFLVIVSWNRSNQFDTRVFNFSFLTLVVVVAFKAPVIGGDTWNYYRYFEGIRNYYSSDSREFEPLFVFYQEILQVLFLKNGILFLATTSVLSFLPIYKFINKYSSRKVLSILLFFLFVHYEIYFAALRQMMGFTLLFLGVCCVLEKKKWKWFLYIILSILAYYMHTSMLLFSFVYLLLYFIKISNRYLVLGIIVLTFIVGVILKELDIIRLLEAYSMMEFGAIERIDGYFDESAFDEVGFSLKLIKPTLIGFFIFLFLDKIRINHWFSKIVLVNVIICNLLVDFHELLRISIGFELFSIIVFTWICERKRNYSIIHRASVFLILFIFVITFLKNDWEFNPRSDSRMKPYYFFFQDYSDHPSIKSRD